MPMTIKLLRTTAGVGARGAELRVDDELANLLVSQGAAQQVTPFEIDGTVTGAPPWSAEKFDAEATRAKAVAEAVDHAAGLQARADKDADAAEEARAKELGDTGPPPAPAVAGLGLPATGVVGGAAGPQGGSAVPHAASEPSKVAGEGEGTGKQDTAATGKQPAKK